jgi:hypothetical protein
VGTIVFFGGVTTFSCLVQYPMLAGHAGELTAGASPVAIFANLMGVHWLALAVDVLLVPTTVDGTVALYHLGARIVATTAADGLAVIARQIHPRLHSPYIAVVALSIVRALAPHSAASHVANIAPALERLSGKPCHLLLDRAVLHHLSGNSAVMRRERMPSLPTAVAAWLSMAAIVYVVVELFRSPVDAGTTHLPYRALGTIVIMAIVSAITATSRRRMTRDVEQVL